MVYSMHAADIDTVLVGGKVLLDQGKLIAADEAEIMAKAVEWSGKIKEGHSHS